MKRYHYVIFDLDGTLLNTEPGIVLSLRDMTAQLCLPEIPPSDYRHFIGPPIEISVHDYFGLSKAEATQAAKVFRDAYSNKYLFEATPYDGIIPLLDRLRSYEIKIAIATYKRHDYAVRVMEHFGLTTYCYPCLGSNAERTSKAAIIQSCMDILSADPSQAVYIGDTEHDHRGAEECGIDFIGVSYGFGFAGDLSVVKLSELLIGDR